MPLSSFGVVNEHINLQDISLKHFFSLVMLNSVGQIRTAFSYQDIFLCVLQFIKQAVFFFLCSPSIPSLSDLVLSGKQNHGERNE